jgi:hypothetical protein
MNLNASRCGHAGPSRLLLSEFPRVAESRLVEEPQGHRAHLSARDVVCADRLEGRSISFNGLRNDPFRVFLHPVAEMEALLNGQGLAKGLG